MKRVSILLAVQIVVLGLCASNTPARTARFVARFPSLSPLLREEPMYEFTIKHLDPEAGIFYSRLSLEELEAEDINRSDEWSRILREWKDRRYADFLAHYSPLIHPFLYEMRIHIFRRDRRLEEARQAKTDNARHEALFIAFRENLILEKHFGRALEKSGYKWDSKQRAEAAAANDGARPYRSPVSAGRFQVKETHLWAGILLSLLALAAVNGLAARKVRPPGPRGPMSA